MFKDDEPLDFQLFGDVDQIPPEPEEDSINIDVEKDDEGAMAKADLYKAAKYAYRLFKKIQDTDQLESWVQAKIVKAADYLASVYHYMEYEMEFSEYGKRLENSDMYTEEQKREISNKLMEARAKLADVKITQADRMTKRGKAGDTVIKPKPAKSACKAVEPMDEAKRKPSAGMTKKQKSAVAKKARAGKDIGKKGKGFKKVAAAAKKSGARDPEAVAAAAMWKTAKKKALKEEVDRDSDNDGVKTIRMAVYIPGSERTFYDSIVKFSIENEDGQPKVNLHSVVDEKTGEEFEITDRMYQDLSDTIRHHNPDIFPQSTEYDADEDERYAQDEEDYPFGDSESEEEEEDAKASAKINDELAKYRKQYGFDTDKESEDEVLREMADMNHILTLAGLKQLNG